MKRQFKKTKGLIKGTPSAVLLSVVIHFILLFVAGGLVVFSVVQKSEKKFVPPPPVERPKMKLIKPKVKVKKTVRPGLTQRIVSRANRSMPDIQLPALEGMGEGLSSGIGGFELMPDFADISLFGSAQSVAMGNDFEGTFYSLALDRRMQEIDMDRDKAYDLARQFCDAGWNPFVFAPYYRSPRKLYATHFMIPVFPSQMGPEAFGYDDPNFPPLDWLVHYKGTIASRRGGRFRFWGAGDDLFIIRLSGKVVLDASWFDKRGEGSGWEPSADEDSKYELGNGHAKVGDWFELEAETAVEMEVLMYENGGRGCFMLMIEDESENYPRNKDDFPVLPAFKTADFPGVIKTEIEYRMVRDRVDLDSELMFNVH